VGRADLGNRRDFGSRSTARSAIEATLRTGGGDHGEIRTAVRLQRCHRGIAPRRSLSSPSSHLSCRSAAVPPPRSVLPRGRPPVHEPGVTRSEG